MAALVLLMQKMMTAALAANRNETQAKDTEDRTIHRVELVRASVSCTLAHNIARKLKSSLEQVKCSRKIYCIHTRIKISIALLML